MGVRALVAWLCATFALLTALVFGSTAGDFRTPVRKAQFSAHATSRAHSGPTLTRSVARHDSVSVVPRRSEVQVRLERGWSDNSTPPFSSLPDYARYVAPDRRVFVIGSAHEVAYERQIPRVRKRIPRMNSEEPPWC